MKHYFPMTYRFDDKRILLIGAGSISDFKFQKIALFNPAEICVVAEEFKSSFNKIERDNFSYLEKSFEYSDIRGFDIVIVAIDDAKLQREIYSYCKSHKILCNCVDLIDCCDFIFPSIVKRGDISVSISSNGVLPGFSAVMREYLDKIIPQDIDKGFGELVALRKSLAPGPERMKFIRLKAREYFDTIIKGF